MPILVMKFGGTSVANLNRIRRAAKRVGVEVAKGYDVIVIVSAMSGKTNELVGWVNETSPLFDAREYDAVVSSGENVTAGLMALTLQEMDVPARSWQGWQVRLEPMTATLPHGSKKSRPTTSWPISAKVCVWPWLQAFRASTRWPDHHVGAAGPTRPRWPLRRLLSGTLRYLHGCRWSIRPTRASVPRPGSSWDRFRGNAGTCSLGAKVLQTRSVELAMRFGAPAGPVEL